MTEFKRGDKVIVKRGVETEDWSIGEVFAVSDHGALHPWCAVSFEGRSKVHHPNDLELPGNLVNMKHRTVTVTIGMWEDSKGFGLSQFDLFLALRSVTGGSLGNTSDVTRVFAVSP